MTQSHARVTAVTAAFFQREYLSFYPRAAHKAHFSPTQRLRSHLHLGPRWRCSMRRSLVLTVSTALLLATIARAGTIKIQPTTTLAAETTNNTSTANSFGTQTNGNAGAGNVSKINIHALLYAANSTKVYAHWMGWFGGSNHMNVGYSSTDPAQAHRQVVDMMNRGINGIVVDWYGSGNSIDQATQLMMHEAETHSGFTFAIMVDKGAIKWNS